MLLEDVRAKFVAAKHHVSPRDDVDAAAAAWFLERAPKTLANWRSKKIGPVYIDLGRGIRYPLIGLLEYLERLIQWVEK